MLAFGLGVPELLIILVVVLLLFGAARLPKLARSLGEAKREFDKGMTDSNGHKSEEPGKTSPDS